MYIYECNYIYFYTYEYKVEIILYIYIYIYIYMFQNVAFQAGTILQMHRLRI